MSEVIKKPPIKETVGAQYICFDASETVGEYTGTFETAVEKTEVVKTVTVTENVESTPVYASGIIYTTATQTASYEISVETIAFDDNTLAKMRGDLTDSGGLNMSGGSRKRPYFAYGKVVEYEAGKLRLDWYPKCQLTANTDQANTRTASFSEQTDTLTIMAQPFNDSKDCRTYVSYGINWPSGLTQAKFFSKPILTAADLASVISGS
jgi:phi13 family phage major tail protein